MTAHPPSIKPGTVCRALAIAGLLLPFTSHSQSLDHFAREWVDQAMASAPTSQGGITLRPEVVMGTLDPRLQLAPCARVEPYLPRGTQLWGRSRIGLKCVEGPVAWNVFLPITVKAWGPAWVVKRTVPANTPVTLADVEQVAEVDWADHRSAVLPQLEQWQGMLAAYTLTPGQPLRENSVRAPQAFGAGSQVKIVATGPGFQLTASGQAMTTGYVGQVARVKLENGKVLTGKVRPEGSVEVNI
ncbi:flagella basal body P-ring formation protein FlgA [Hydrogenophaga soli]|nr:flagellar basal body P-ring formation chaperone FlgA [Burkholderiaceae bacterium]